MIRLLLFTLFFGLSLTAEESVRLKIKQPNWRLEKIESYENGAPKKIIFYEPTPNNSERAVKQLVYQIDGTLQTESDLQETVLHGPSISYFPDGRVEKVELYENGELKGPVRLYHPNGLVRQEYSIQGRRKEGNWSTHFTSGKIKEEGFYHLGAFEGPYRAFYPNGKLAGEAAYLDGLVHGEAREWYENGTLKTSAFFLKGLLHHERGMSAFRSYHEDGSLKEQQDFIAGQPVGYKKQEIETYTGEFVEKYPDGKLKRRYHYKNDMLDGLQEEFLRIGCG